MSLPAHDPGFVRVGMQHTAAGEAEADGARANIKGKATQRANVFGLILAAGSEGKTGAELFEETSIPRHVLSGRLKELENDGLIVRTSERRTSKSTSVANGIYIAAPKETLL